MSEILYRLTITRPGTHRVQVEMTIPPLAGPLDLGIPAWMPGAYKLVDHGRNVRKVEAMAPDPLVVERRDMHTWRVHGGDNGAVVRYEVFADKLMIHEAQVNADHAFLNGSAVWLAVLGARHLPCRIQVDVPEGWEIVSALDVDRAEGPVTDHRAHYLAPDYDTLADAPLEAGRVSRASVEAEGVTWEIAWHDPCPAPVMNRISEEVKAIAQQAVALFGPPPFSRYVMFFHDCEEPGYLNGLEHRNSMAMQGPLDVLSHPAAFFTMVAHEIIHAWNGQRMAPAGLFRPGCDYFRPAHTTALWVVEGWTEYFASLLMLRAGLIDQTQYLAHLAEMLDSFYRTPGRRCTTLEEASFITWNFGDDRWNGAINYYLKGLLAAFALDVEIRVRTDGARSLDDAVRQLWCEYGCRLPYEPADVERVASQVADASLSEFFDLHLRRTEDPDFEAIARKLGLTLSYTERAALGLRASGTPGALKVEGIEADGPAEDAGLQAGDVLVAIGSLEQGATTCREKSMASEGALTAIGKDFRPGDRLVLTFFRGDLLLETTLRVGAVRRHRLAAMPESGALLAGYLAASHQCLPLPLTLERAHTVAPRAPA